MKHTVELLLVFVALAVCGAVATAQQPKKVLRLGYLSAADPTREATRAEAIRLLCASLAT